ncbi:hypothetical protein BUALT_Bualt02G0135100 [Buddleja alternifolia]|uniref:Uncharacterized protein n=1 Tax=Buddleja alternifolia TaxID=168488 RepID=A0AAV6YB01_9LAMI|nr:hypothetical protein BUALT_Bualt02G0135100 [Buddleja alternifolia]
MSQSSYTFRPQEDTLHKCDYRQPKTARLRTSWTDGNPGRRSLKFVIVTSFINTETVDNRRQYGIRMVWCLKFTVNLQ